MTQPSSDGIVLYDNQPNSIERAVNFGETNNAHSYEQDFTFSAHIDRLDTPILEKINPIVTLLPITPSKNNEHTDIEDSAANSKSVGLSGENSDPVTSLSPYHSPILETKLVNRNDIAVFNYQQSKWDTAKKQADDELRSLVRISLPSFENDQDQSNQDQPKQPTQVEPQAINQQDIGWAWAQVVFSLIMGPMWVMVQPKADSRARYAIDGRRFLPGSKKNPMSIRLPDLSGYTLRDNQKFGIVITIVTSTENPQNKTFVHVNNIQYCTDDAIQIDHGTVFIPLAESDITNGEKKFPRLSIVCTKYGNYTFDLVSFSTTNTNRETKKFMVANEESIGIVAKGKRFVEIYNLDSYKFVFQLVIREDNRVHFSQIWCETEVVVEQKAPSKAIKRSTPPLELDEESIAAPVPSPAKRLKPETSLLNELPVVYVKNNHAN